MLNITSDVFEGEAIIPTKYTCDGENMSPPLTISGISQGTKSLALIVHDPDAPGKGFTHWIVFNISPARPDFLEGQIPAQSIEGNNSAGELGYTGPCPPSGTHHYEFHLYALDIDLKLASGSSIKDVQAAIKDHIVEETTLVGLYSREE